MLGRKTKILVLNDESLVKDADFVIFVRNGRIEWKGRREEFDF